MATGLLGAAAGLIGDALAPYALISSPMRAIGSIIPDVVISEGHSNDLAITDHPVETGAAISDHAFKLPSRVIMRCGFSNSTAGTEGYVQQVVQMFKSLQASRDPIDVLTGKEFLQGMLVERLAYETDENTENSLILIVGLRQIILTQTQTTGASKASQAMPEKTAVSTDIGTVQLIPGAPIAPPVPSTSGSLTLFDPANPSATFVAVSDLELSSAVPAFGRPDAFDAKGASLF